MSAREKLVELFYDNNVICDQKIEGLADDVMEIITHSVTVQEWISVEDRLPENEKPVLTFVGYEESMIGFITVSSYFCFDPNPHWQWDGLLKDEQKTLFWMPLPQTPKGE